MAAQFCFHSTLRDADKHGAVVVGVLDEDEEGLRDEVVLAQVAVSQGQEQAVLPRRLVQQASTDGQTEPCFYLYRCYDEHTLPSPRGPGPSGGRHRRCSRPGPGHAPAPPPPPSHRRSGRPRPGHTPAT